MKQSTVIKPVITEKSLALASRGWYTFAVTSHATKNMVSSEIASRYGVTVKQTRSVSMHGKTRRVGKKQTMVTKQDWKKMVVAVAKGQKIDAFEVTAEESTK